MKNFLLLFALVSQSFSFCQEKYSFNYLLLYDENCMQHRDSNDFVFLVDSKNNDFTLSAYEKMEKDNQNYGLSFHNQSGKHVNTKVAREDFYKAETITTECSNYIDIETNNRHLVKKYSFENLADTLINDTLYYHYVFKNNQKEKYKKRKNIGITHYIVYQNDSDFLPILNGHIDYEVWKRDKNIPNGCLKMRYYIDYNGAKKSKIVLRKKIATTKKFIIPKECETGVIAIDLKALQKT